MTKILSICIASYNMEEYLPRCVESMLGAGVNDELEIIIVNDGSTDSTLEIANGYKAQYPDTVVVIDKENGHYGSCINASLKVAKGKYYRTVDADDWVDSTALKQFVQILKTNDADCFVTHYSEYFVKTKRSALIKTNAPEWNKVLQVDNLAIADFPEQMHTITWRLNLLIETNYSQTEGVNYSDMEYVWQPMFYAKTIFFADLNLYQYLLGRENQSVSSKVLARSLPHRIILLQKMRAFKMDRERCNNQADKLLEKAYNQRVGHIFRNHIIFNHKDKEEAKYLRAKLEELLAKGVRYEDLIGKTRFNPIRLWHQSGIMNRMILSVR